MPHKSTPRRAAIYCRVSDPGAADKYGMDAQRAECIAYAERHGWQVVAIFEDYQTGTELFERAEMTRCREAMRRREFDVLLVDRLNRLSRKAHHQGFIRTEAEYAGVAIASATEDLSNPILVGVYGGMAEVTKDADVKNMARGKRIKATDHGLPLGQGKPPYGLAWRTTAQPKPDGSVLVRKVGYDEDPATIGHLRRIYSDYAGRLSLRALALALEADGVLPPYHARTGRTTWSAGTLRALLTDRVYLGEAEAFGPRVHANATRRAATRAGIDHDLLISACRCRPAPRPPSSTRPCSPACRRGWSTTSASPAGMTATRRSVSCGAATPSAPHAGIRSSSIRAATAARPTVATRTASGCGAVLASVPSPWMNSTTTSGTG